MTDTAISSQVASEVYNTASTVAGDRAAESSGTQASDFDDILGSELAAGEKSVEDQNNQVPALLNLNALLNVTPLQNTLPDTSRTVGGNILPGALLADSALLNGQNPEQASANLLDNTRLVNMPLEGEYRAGIERVNLSPALLAKLKTDSSMNLASGMTSPGITDEDILSTQISSLFTEKNLPNVKQLNAQLFNQFMHQAASAQQATVDHSALAGATPGIVFNQSLSLHSSEAVLPAMTVTPDSPQWNAQLGERINWMVNNNIQRADIRLDPPELGNLDIRLNIAKDNQASILIHVNNATAKEAIESAIPRLREMFEQQGLDLANVDVSQQNLQQQQSAFEQFNNNDMDQFEQNSLSDEARASINQHDGDILATSNISTMQNENLLDIYA